MSKNAPEMITNAEVEKQKAWERIADSIWRNNVSGMLYERPKINGKFTFRSLMTKNQKHAKEEFHRRRSGVTNTSKISTITTGAVIRKYQESDYPDQQRQPRPARMHELEERNCKVLMSFWDKVPVDEVTIANCDRYHDTRCSKMVRGGGHRAVDLDLNTLSNAFVWACRCEMVQAEPSRDTPSLLLRKVRSPLPRVHAGKRRRIAQARSLVFWWRALAVGSAGLAGTHRGDDGAADMRSVAVAR
jgi:hypothetical protein